MSFHFDPWTNPPGMPTADSVWHAYQRGREEYAAHFFEKRTTCITGGDPSNPYPEGTPEYDAYDRGYYEVKDECVLVEMGR